MATAKRLSDDELVKRIIGFYLVSDDDSQTERLMQKKAYDYRLGRQWTDPTSGEDLKATRKAKGKHSLTYNLIGPRIDLLAGVFERTRTEPVFVPRSGGTVKGAKLITEIIKHTRDVSRASYVEAHAFDDGNTCGQGWFMAEIDVVYDPFGGQLKLKRLSPKDVFWDTGCQDYDLNNGARFVIYTYWLDKDEAAARYPKKADELGALFGSINPQKGALVWGNEELYAHGVDKVLKQAHEKWSHRVMMCFWRTWRTEDRLVDNQELAWAVIGDDETPGEVSQEKAELYVMADKVRYAIVHDVLVPELHRTILLGGIVLRHDEKIMGGIINYPVYRYCPKWIDGETPGLVEGAIDAQMEYNGRLTEALDHLKRTAHSGWKIAEGSVTTAQRTAYEEFGSRPGIILGWIEGKLEPQQIVPAPLAAAHIQLAREAAFRISEIMGVNTESMGFEQPRKESGVAIRERKEAGLTVNEPIYRNFRMTQEICSESLLEIIRKTAEAGMPIYTDREIDAIAEGSPDIDPDALTDWKIGRYGVVATHKAATPTERAANLDALIALNKELPGVIPPEMILENTDIANKEEIIEAVRQRTMAAAGAGGSPGENAFANLQTEEPI